MKCVNCRMLTQRDIDAEYIWEGASLCFVCMVLAWRRRDVNK